MSRSKSKFWRGLRDNSADMPGRCWYGGQSNSGDHLLCPDCGIHRIHVCLAREASQCLQLCFTGIFSYVSCIRSLNMLIDKAMMEAVVQDACLLTILRLFVEVDESQVEATLEAVKRLAEKAGKYIRKVSGLICIGCLNTEDHQRCQQVVELGSDLALLRNKVRSARTSTVSGEHPLLQSTYLPQNPLSPATRLPKGAGSTSAVNHRYYVTESFSVYAWISQTPLCCL